MAARVTAQHVVEYAGARALAALMRALPLDAASGLTARAFALLMPRTKRHARALEHLALALPELPEAERERIARRMWGELGRVAGEALVFDRLIADPGRLELPDDFAHFKALAADGAIMATPHLGSWELTGWMAARAGLPLAGIYQALHNPLAERYLKAMRAPVFPAGLYAKGPELGRTLIRHARAGTSIGLAGDLREKRGIIVEFFGRPAYATPLPAMLSRLSGRPLIAGAAIRIRGSRYRGLLEQVVVPSTGDRDGDIAAGTQALHDVFERMIRADPDAYMWTHRKWAGSSHRDGPGALARATPPRADAA